MQRRPNAAGLSPRAVRVTLVSLASFQAMPKIVTTADVSTDVAARRVIHIQTSAGAGEMYTVRIGRPSRWIGAGR
jgi:hypothetical protein